MNGYDSRHQNKSRRCVTLECGTQTPSRRRIERTKDQTRNSCDFGNPPPSYGDDDELEIRTGDSRAPRTAMLRSTLSFSRCLVWVRSLYSIQFVSLGFSPPNGLAISFDSILIISKINRFFLCVSLSRSSEGFSIHGRVKIPSTWFPYINLYYFDFCQCFC